MNGKTTGLVLGARPGTGNIGEAIYDKLDRRKDWLVDHNDCQVEDNLYGVPSVPWEDYDALVVTLGKEGITPMAECDDFDIVSIIEANLMLPLRCIRAWLEAREASKLGGQCVVIGSYAYDHSPTSCVPYCAAKAGLAHAVQGLAWELTSQGYYFHIVHPYHVPSTPMGVRVVQAMMEVRGMGLEEAHEYQMKDMRLREHLSPEDIARVVCWLLTEPVAPWLSGTGLSLYGGVR
jgi:NAD(P)-dependent dehydrogenase (short-subunit alcohol dehydrogenase family)